MIIDCFKIFLQSNICIFNNVENQTYLNQKYFKFSTQIKPNKTGMVIDYSLSELYMIVLSSIQDGSHNKKQTFLHVMLE